MGELERSIFNKHEDRSQIQDTLATEVLNGLQPEMAVEAFELCITKLPDMLVHDYSMLILCDSAGKRLVYHLVNNSHDDSVLLRCEDWGVATIGRNAASVSLETAEPAVVAFHEHGSERLANMQSCAAPIVQNGTLEAVLLIITHKKTGREQLIGGLENVKALFLCCLELAQERKRSRELTTLHESSYLDAGKRDLLFQTAKKLLSLIDVDHVLTEMIDNVKKLYPSAQVDLFLTQDKHNSKLPVKPLNFSRAGDDICTRSFMEGQLLYEMSEAGGIAGGSAVAATIAAPLTGKQGVYGVLRLGLTTDMLDSTDIQLISMLADTAGTAFENAILYEQSNLLVGELRLINEITKRLNQSLRLNEIFNFAMSELIQIFGADFCCILQLDKENERLVVQASNLPALFNEIFKMDYGFSGIVYATKEPIIISDYWTNPKVTSKLMEVTNARSLLASPIMVNGDVVGVVLVAHSKPHFFSYDNYKLLQVLSGHVGLAITNASLHAEVRRMVITDNLTGMYVRHYLDEQVSVHQKKDFCGSLILVDIDHFKRVNDTYGHQIGDKILIQVSQIMKSSIRESDIAARWGGEELAIYLPGVTIEQTVRIAERIRTRVHTETDPQVTVSCGVSEWNWQDDKISVETLFYKADMALYEAKNSGRNQIKVG
ncbi:sensor domain-containing diguanylate cyclase [Paenibacillus thalictri]|nr:sensor domain-containing diguanylate cyclase [Paenibacillus thalictri]